MTSTTVRAARADELPAIKELAVAAGMFTLDEVDFFDEMFGGFLDGSLEGHRWVVAVDADRAVRGAAQFAPEPFSDRLWNLYFLAVAPSHQGRGIGQTLVGAVGSELTQLGEASARVLIVETSSTEQFAGARAFYSHLGFDEEARIREFYGPDDHKVTFWRSLTK